MTNTLEVLGLCKKFETFALDDVTFCVPGGSIMGFIGENGAGKSTTMKCILGLLRPDGGTIRILGKPIGDATLRQEVGVVLDSCFFHDTLTPKDVGQILAPIYHSWDKDAYFGYLKQFKLPPSQPIKEFSRGMKMKLSLSAALSHHPKLLILDEATAGLDPVVRDEILEEFQNFICDNEHSILISSHITSDLEKVADYITYLHQGRVVISQEKDEILAHYGRVGCTEAQVSALDRGEYLALHRTSFGCTLLVENRHSFQRNHPDMMVEPTTFEEIMLLLGKEERT